MKKVCIVGYGAIGKIHADAVKKCKNATVYAVCDIDKERANSGAKVYGAKIFYDFYEALNDKNIDAFHICTPHHLHCEMALAAAEKDKEIILEKPVAISFDELELMKEKLCGKKVCIAVQNRLNKPVAELKKIIEQKQFGELLGGAAQVFWHRDSAYYNADEWRGKWKTEGGGVVINQAIHTVDLISYLCGGIKTVRCGMAKRSDLPIEVEDTADAIFTLNDGKKVSFFATNAAGVNFSVQVEFQFEKAFIRYCDNCLYKITDGGVEIISEVDNKYKGKIYWGNGHETLIDNFYSGGTYSSFTDTYNTMKTVFKMYESAKNGSIELSI